MFETRVNTREIDGLAAKLRKSDMSKAMTAIAGIMLDAVEENFEREGRPETWTPLADATVEDRRKKGFGPEHTILQRTGTLAASVQADSGDSRGLPTNPRPAGRPPGRLRRLRGEAWIAKRRAASRLHDTCEVH